MKLSKNDKATLAKIGVDKAQATAIEKAQGVRYAVVHKKGFVLRWIGKAEAVKLLGVTEFLKCLATSVSRYTAMAVSDTGEIVYFDNTKAIM